MQMKHTKVCHTYKVLVIITYAAGAKYYTGITDKKELHQKLLMSQFQNKSIKQYACKRYYDLHLIPHLVSLSLIQVQIHQGN